MNISVMAISLNDKINAIMSVLTRPNQTIREIVENDQKYFVTAIAILVISSFFFVGYTTEELDSSLSINEIGYVLDAGYQAEGFGKSVLWNALSIVLVFYIGMSLGGNNSFKKVFSVMAFAMIPVLIGGAILHIFLIYPPVLENITGIDANNPEFAGLFWPLYFVLIPFALWSFILSIKAIKIVDNFGIAKALGILIASTIVIYFVDWIITLAL